MEGKLQGNSDKGVEQDRYTTSGFPVNGVYTPDDTKNIEYTNHLGNPGEYPFTRAAYRSG